MTTPHRQLPVAARVITELPMAAAKADSAAPAVVCCQRAGRAAGFRAADWPAGGYPGAPGSENQVEFPIGSVNQACFAGWSILAL